MFYINAIFRIVYIYIYICSIQMLYLVIVFYINARYVGNLPRLPGHTGAVPSVLRQRGRMVLSLFLYVYLSLSLSLSIYIYIYVYVCMHRYLSIYPSIHPSIYPRPYLPYSARSAYSVK